MDSSTKKHNEGSLMKTHFLKPYVTAIDGGVAELPRQRFSVSSSNIEDAFSRISFSGFWSADGSFKTWVMKMQALHEPIWRKAGIFEAIKASTYKIRKDQSLVLPLVEKWCHETKTFIFPWGEATITLEDVMVLLGFSVLGSSVFAPLESSEMRDSLEKLQIKTREIRIKDKDLRQGSWIPSFLGRGDQMEHEAFLVLWLSFFVFPGKARPGISKHVFPIAVRLARGERIALAPAVLAKIYRDLSQIQASAREESTRNVNLKSLFKLVQVWSWERFKNTRPTTAREIPIGDPRIAQWDNLPQRSEKVRLSCDDFEWRPYTKPLPNWSPLRLYVEEAMWVTVDDNIDDEFVSFARCVRSSKLVGIGIVEDYYPNRVAMQFGLDQELPGLVLDHSIFIEKEAWDDYNKSLDGSELYMPSRLATNSVTKKYQNWWLKSISKFLDSSEPTETYNASSTIVDANSGASTSTELPLSQLYKEELAKRTSEHLRNKGCKRAREDDKSARDYKDGEKDDNIIIAHKKLATQEMVLNLEARMTKVEKTLAMIRELRVKRNRMKNGISA